MSMHAWRRGRWRAPTAAALVCLAGVGVVLAAREPAVSRRDADAFERKVIEIRQYGSAPLQGSRVTPVSESEVNSFLRYTAASEIPAGVREPSVTMLDGSRVSGRALVDLDAAREARGRGAFDPMNLVGGQLEVAADGRLLVEDGRARFDLETATVGGVPIPKAVLQELVAYYTRSPEYPAGLDIDDAFELPARIREIHVRRGQAVVVQR